MNDLAGADCVDDESGGLLKGCDLGTTEVKQCSRSRGTVDGGVESRDEVVNKEIIPELPAMIVENEGLSAQGLVDKVVENVVWGAWERSFATVDAADNKRKGFDCVLPGEIVDQLQFLVLMTAILANWYLRMVFVNRKIGGYAVGIP